MQFQLRQIVLGYLASLFLWGSSGAVFAQPISGLIDQELPVAVSNMKSLIEQGRFGEAFNLGLRHDFLSGDPRYDYYYGVAAIESGRAALGVLALERLLLSNPENDLARLELARGYFVLSDYERSKEAFTFLLGKQLPVGVRASVEKYVGAIRKKDPNFNIGLRGYAEYTIGSYSDINSSVDRLLPSLLSGQNNVPVELDPGKAVSSNFSQIALGASSSGQIVSGIKYTVSFEGDYRQLASVDNYDHGLGAITGGIEFAGEKERYRLAGFYSEAYFDNKRTRDVVGVGVEWMRPITKETSIRSALSFAQLRYPVKTNRDADLPSFSIGASRFLGGAWNSGLDLDLLISREKNLKNQSNLSRDIYGLRVSWGFSPSPRWRGSLTGGYSKSVYDAPEPVAPTVDEYKRYDLISAEFGLQYQLTGGWSAGGEVIHSENRAKVSLYRFDQQVYLFKMRYEWR